MSEVSLGRRLLAAGSLAELEAVAGAEPEALTALDSMGDGLFSSMLGAQRLVEVQSRSSEGAKVVMPALDEPQRELIADLYTLSRMEERGAWFVPEVLTLSPGHCQFPFHVEQNPRFPISAIADDGIRVQTAGSPEAVLIWALLEPWGRLLFRVLELSGSFASDAVYADRRADWASDQQQLSWLGFDLTRLQPERPFRVASMADQISRRNELVGVLREQANQALARKFRLARLRALVKAYYAKADKEGRVLRRRALTREVQPILCAYFGGGWLEFVAYLGEQPHPDEDIVSGLPATKLYIESKPSEQLAVAAGVSASAAEAVLASFFRTSQPASPVEARLTVLERYWQVLDELHARQRPGMPSLSGVVVEYPWLIGQAGDQHESARYLHVLPPDLLADVERLWGTQIIDSAPERIAMSTSPHQLLAQVCGPALSFWNGVALTLWFVTQGPYSRTELDNIRDYYGRQISAMTQLGCPVSEEFFADMDSADKKILGKPEEVWEDGGRTGVVTFQISTGTQRSGFEKARDLMTEHRRAWISKYLQMYLRKQCEAQLGGAVHDYERLLANRGKPPTIKQFIKHAVEPANHWFGGNVRDLYSAFGASCPIQPILVARPLDRIKFALIAYRGFGGAEESDDPGIRLENWIAQRFANTSIRFLMLEQILDRQPTMREFGIGDIEYAARNLKTDLDAIWTWYLQVISWTKAQLQII